MPKYLLSETTRMGDMPQGHSFCIGSVINTFQNIPLLPRNREEANVGVDKPQYCGEFKLARKKMVLRNRQVSECILSGGEKEPMLSAV